MPDQTFPNCYRCGHPAAWHRFDDAQETDVTLPEAKFRCIGYDCEAEGPPPAQGCPCPDWVRPWR